MAVTRLKTTSGDPLGPPFLKGGALVIAALLFAIPPAMSFDEPATGNGPAGAAQVRGSTETRLPDRVPALASIPRLGDPRFEVREEATRALEQGGIAAIGPLREAAAGENLEITCRAIRSLASIFDTSDDATFDAAEEALEQLEASANRSAARRAAVALASQPVRRWKRAVVRFNLLGGGVKWKGRNDMELPEPNPELGGELVPTHVILKEKWSGGGGGLVNIKRMNYALFAYYGLMSPAPRPLPVYAIDGADVPPEALEELQQSLPGLEISSRGRARLGVSCDARAGPCMISGIERNSAAEKAGLRALDVVVRYDGETVDTFDQLTQITRRHKVADRIKLEVLREGQIVELEAELSGWDDAEPVPKPK